MPQRTDTPTHGWLESIEERSGTALPAIRKAKLDTEKWLSVLHAAFEEKIAPDTSLVLFGSIARQEMTTGSDSDWILLIDGSATPGHKDEERRIVRELRELKFKDPGKSGVFGCMAGSHDLVHKIGGEDDLNSNTTRRVLLLLESVPIGDRDAYDRVVRQILVRYLQDDRGLQFSRGQYKVPRFLLNDLTRYWRTVTVDFVYKQRSQAGEKWALRNAKLRMSRKLIFATGLLRCFFCQLDESAQAAREDLYGPQHKVDKMLAYLEEQLRETPLQLLARAASGPGVADETARSLFVSYDRFLNILDDGDKRSELARTTPDEIDESPVWDDIRTVSREFHRGLIKLFFEEHEHLGDLAKEYAVF